MLVCTMFLLRIKTLNKIHQAIECKNVIWSWLLTDGYITIIYLFVWKTMNYDIELVSHNFYTVISSTYLYVTN